MRKISDPDFIDIINKHDIIILTETWLSPKTHINLNIQGYSAEHLMGNKSHNTRKGRHSGGISIYYKSSLQGKIDIVEKHQCGIIWLKICKSIFHFNVDVYLCCTYIPPRESKVLSNNEIDIFSDLELHVEKYKLLGKVLLTGDLNSRTANEIDYINFDRFLDNNSDIQPNVYVSPRVNKDHVLDPFGTRLIDMCKTTNLLIANGRLHSDRLVGDYTFVNHKGMSMVDYLLLNFDDFEYITQFEIMQINDLSDHSALHFCIERSCHNEAPREHNTGHDLFLAWDEAKIPTFREFLLDDISRLNQLTTNLLNNTINDTMSSFTLYMQENAFKVFGKTKKNIQPINRNDKKRWFNKDCYEARKEFNHARNMFLRNKTDDNKAAFLTKKRAYVLLKRNCKRNYNKLESKRISILAKTSPKLFWKNVKSQYQKAKNEPANVSINDMYIHFNDLYGSTTNDNHTDLNVMPHENYTNDNDLDIEFTLMEIKQAVFSQNNSKSPGTDQLIAEVFKNSFDIISPFLTVFYNTLFNDGVFPECWAEGVIVPIFKGGTPEAKNYRGITLNNILSKIYSKLLVTRLTKWADKHDKFIDNQYGFQKNKSTTDCIFILHAVITKTLSNKKKLYAAFLDWEKMFDKIDRLLLWQKLLNENVSTKFINAIKSMYTTVRSSVKYKSAKSHLITSHIGVKQGDPSSSILCLFFLNDILNSINENIDGILNIDNLKLFLILFADDAVIFANNPASLQSILNDLGQYCNIWNLKLNVNKTKIMIFENSRPTLYDFFLNDTRIEIVNSFKYLGIHFFKNGNWSRTQKVIAQHAAFSLHNLFIVYNQLDLPISQKINLFDSLVLPVLNYSAEIWGYHSSPDVEAIFSKFCKRILCVKQTTNLNALYGELGRIPMHAYRKLIIIKYWLKLLSMNEQTIIFKVYIMLKTDADKGLSYNGKNWAYNIKMTLNQLGLTDLWENQFRTSISYTRIKQRMLDIFQQSWCSSINNSARLDTYCFFKNSFNLEKYLDVIKVSKFRIALTRLRTSSHNLKIESGRHHNIPRNERICENCNSGLVENEYHFLLICSKFSGLRLKYIKRYYYTWPTKQTLINLMSSSSDVVINNLAKYIYYANNMRS